MLEKAKQSALGGRSRGGVCRVPWCQFPRAAGFSASAPHAPPAAPGSCCRPRPRARARAPAPATRRRLHRPADTGGHILSPLQTLTFPCAERMVNHPQDLFGLSYKTLKNAKVCSAGADARAPRRCGRSAVCGGRPPLGPGAGVSYPSPPPATAAEAAAGFLTCRCERSHTRSWKWE